MCHQNNWYLFGDRSFCNCVLCNQANKTGSNPPHLGTLPLIFSLYLQKISIKLLRMSLNMGMSFNKLKGKLANNFLVNLCI